MVPLYLGAAKRDLSSASWNRSADSRDLGTVIRILSAASWDLGTVTRNLGTVESEIGTVKLFSQPMLSVQRDRLSRCGTVRPASKTGTAQRIPLQVSKLQAHC